MKEYGENIGMVFQIRDDLLDYIGRRSIIGKPTGLDMKEKKLTLPLIYSFSKAPRSQVKSILRTIKNGASRKDLHSIVEFAQEFGGIEYATKKAEKYSKVALIALQTLPDSPSKKALADFVGFVLERTK